MSSPARISGSRVIYLDADPNDFDWDLSDVGGLEFEAEIQTAVRSTLRPDGKNIRVIDTERTGDRGKDIVVHFKNNISVFGFEFKVPRGKELGKLFIECKKYNGRTLAADKSGGSLVQLKADGDAPDYFLLVTNATLTPELHYNIVNSFLCYGCQFFLADRRRLAVALQGAKARLRPPEQVGDPASVAISYSVFDRDSMRCILSSPEDKEGEPGNRKVLEVFIVLNNYTTDSKNVQLLLRSDINWSISTQDHMADDEFNALEFIIPPFGSCAKKLRLERQSFDGLDGLRLGVNVDGRPRTLEIQGRKLLFDFDPPLFGDGHIDLVATIQNAVQREAPARLISLRGHAGTGKSKVMEELAARLHGSNRYLRRVELRRKNISANLSLIANDLANINNKEPPKYIHDASDFFECIKDIGDRYEHYVICIEDMHHANCDLISQLIRFFDDKEAVNFTIIITGRTDGTIVNDDYFTFLDRIAIFLSTAKGEARDAILDLALEPWSDDDCRSFIRTTVSEVPELVLNQIHKLSENTPFGVIQSIEYLLDLDIAKVTNRNTVGITNAESFGGKLDLPKKLRKLIAQRHKHLVKSSGDERATVLMIALAFLGMQVDGEMLRRLATDPRDTSALEAAESRRFLEVQGGHVRFMHENLQVFFLGMLQTDKRGVKAAALLLNIKEAVVDQHQRGLLQVVARRHEEGFASLHDLWQSAIAIKNISSADVPSENLQYFPSLIAAARTLNKADAAIARLCVVETYGALHNTSLAIALETARRQYSIIAGLNLPSDERESFDAEIKQLEAHILLNMGYVLSAQKIMLETAARASLSPKLSGNHRLMFDLYDRLQNIYHQINHKTQFINFSELSRREAETRNDEKLLALVRASRAKEHAYDDPLMFLEKTREATIWAEEHASPRHVCHMKMNLAIAELMAAPSDSALVRNQISILATLLEEAGEKAYAFSITRAELALASAYALLGLNREENRKAADRYTRIGIESCLRFGSGFFPWQLHNLLAIIELNQPDSNTERAMRHWRTAIQYLDRQGLLFLGNLDSCNQNLAVISNFVRFLYRCVSEESAYRLIGMLRTYDGGQRQPARQHKELLESVLNYGLIGRTAPLPIPFSEPVEGYLLALR